MQSSLDPLPSLLPPEGAVIPTIPEVVARAVRGESLVLAGSAGSAAGYVAAKLAAHGSVVLVGADSDAAYRLLDDVAFYAPETKRALLLAPDTIPHADVNPDRRASMARLAGLSRLARGEHAVIVVNAAALVRKLVPRAALLASTLTVREEEELDREPFLRALVDSGHQRVPVVEDPGTFAVRGALCDVWPVDAGQPVRIESYGDLVVKIESFDPQDQTTRPHGRLPEVRIPPAREALLGPSAAAHAKASIEELLETIDYATQKAHKLRDDVVAARTFFGADGFLPAYYPALETLFDYLPSGSVPFVREDPGEVSRAVRDEWERAAAGAQEQARVPHYGIGAFYTEETALLGHLGARAVVSLGRSVITGAESGLDRFSSRPEAATAWDLAAQDHADLAKRTKESGTKTTPLAPLLRRLEHYIEHGLRSVLVARTEVQAERLRSLLSHRGVATVTGSKVARGSVELAVGTLSRGLVLPAEALAIITEEEIFGGRVHKARKKAAASGASPFVEDMRSLHVGDFVVHSDHGIGRYVGLVQRNIGGIAVDLLGVEYAGGDKLYLPVYRLNQIQKYAGGESASPKLDRLGGQSFSKTKARVKKAAREMADELLRLYAEREAATGPILPPIDDEYRLFEATFPFEETADQARAIEDMHSDLQKTRPMDRLVCGDVGFGKTEVALRGAFRVAMAGKQVALLCPTTVLAQQHLRSFEARMQNYPITIRGLSRFQTKKEQDETIRLLKEGKVDIVVGTHRLLSKDVHFKDLGLLVVDEEQRFGVTHKERIKQLRKNVHILTLSATPIPRTLQMAVSGVRELSLITTPPTDRRAVRTVVTRHDENVIKDAIQREISRGGQVFYVHGRIEGLYERANRLKELVPNARIAVAHGQMATKKTKGTRTKGGDVEAEASENALERTMLDFVEGRYDVLAATAIVESGLDIARANTILIDRADLFGLAQLYQLRGRVGRSKERAYCYLIVPPVEVMTDDARARIEAVERHTELGSGFKIASLDLELRGAGDLLGGEQSGNVASVGFDLFVQMLADAVRELRGEEVIHDVDPELSFDVSALLPDDYVDDTGLRLSFYKRLAGAYSQAEVESIGVEMENRFGSPPAEAKLFFHLMSLKSELRDLKVLGCEATGARVTLHLREDTPLDPVRITELVRKPRSAYKLTPDMRLTRRFDPPMANGIAAAEKLLDDLATFRRA